MHGEHIKVCQVLSREGGHVVGGTYKQPQVEVRA
jgi:hypothetical protein